MRSENIRLDQINVQDERYRISYYFDLEVLIHSIRRIGLIHPPVVTHKNGEVLIVTGWKRVLACQRLSLLSIPCRVFEGENDLKAFTLGLEENRTFRSFTVLEKAEIVKRLIRFGVSEKVVVRDYLPLLVIPQTMNHLDIYLRIVALEPKTKRFVHEKGVGFPILQLLVDYNEEERRILLPLLRPLGQNKQKDLLQNLLEISKRDGIPARNILRAGDIQEISARENLSPMQIAEQIRNLVLRRRYPTLFAWKEVFETQKKAMEWPKDIKIEPSPNFEDEEFTVHFSFKTFNEYMEKLVKLDLLASQEKIVSLLRSSPDQNE
jgi:ParB family chromosome partitioning protein